MRVLIAAGGTGGHIFPALATMQQMKAIDPAGELIWVTTTRSREKELAQEYGVTPLFLAVEGIQRKVSLQPVKAVVKFVRAFFQMYGFIKRSKIERVVAFGGYVCAPALLAARLLKVPYFLQEQNSVPGLVNRLFSKNAQSTFLGVPLIETAPLAGKTIITGTPVRSRHDSYGNFNFHCELTADDRVVLICGGSQGAQSMNRVLVHAVQWMSEQGIRVIWQTGAPGLAELQERFAQNDRVFCAASMDDLYPYYNRADLLIGRSGASTISEAALFGLPAILIPLPWSAENHQWFNAGVAEHEGWAIRLVQCDETSDQVIETVKSLFVTAPNRYETMREKAIRSAHPEAAQKIAQEVLTC